LLLACRLVIVAGMGAPLQAVTLSPDAIAELNKKLSVMRHDINGDLALIVAAAELIRLNPGSTERMLTTLLEQPAKIRNRTTEFSKEFEKLLGIPQA
jgi:hypothetical protein